MNKTRLARININLFEEIDKRAKDKGVPFSIASSELFQDFKALECVGNKIDFDVKTKKLKSPVTVWRL